MTWIELTLWVTVARALLAILLEFEMTTTTNPDPTGAQGQASGQSAGVSAGTGAGVATQGYAAQGYEGSIKQSTDIGTEEALAVTQSIGAKDAMFDSSLLTANKKRTADQMQSTDLMTLVGDMATRQRNNTLAELALSNAVNNADALAKQMIAHRDIAINAQWNVDEQGYQVAAILRSDTFKDAIAGATAAAVASTLEALAKK